MNDQQRIAKLCSVRSTLSAIQAQMVTVVAEWAPCITCVAVIVTR